MFRGYRKKVFTFEKIPKKTSTTILFISKQLLGGIVFLMLSYLSAYLNVSIFNGLQGFRYVFLFIIALFLSHEHRHILDEEIDHHTIRQKICAIGLIVLGTFILFL